MILKSIRIYGGYIKAGNSRSCAMLPIIVRADSRDEARAMGIAEAHRQFPVTDGYTDHYSDVVEAVITPSGSVQFDPLGGPVTKSPSLHSWPEELEE